jgi:capsular polysaccharide biosynthesis protein
VLLAGPGHLGYGHWIVDFLPKIHLLRLAGYRIDRLRFLLPSDTPGFARDWLALLNVEPSQCRFYDRTREIIDCDELIVPSTLRFGTRVSPLFAKASAAMRQAAIGRTRPSRNRTKLFVSRPTNRFAHNTRVLIQRQLFEETARSRGFTIVSPELLSVPDQVALFQHAGTIVGEYGSGLHSSMFSDPGALVVAARDNREELGFLQSGIDGVLGHQTGYLIGAANLDGSGAFSLEPADIALAFDWMTWRRNP